MARSFSKQFLLDELRRFYEVHGRPPVHKELMPSNGYPSYLTFVKRFGSVKEAMVLAGLPIDKVKERRQPLDPDLMLMLLAKYKIKNGKFPRYTDLCKVGEFKELPHRRTYETKFGSYDKAKELVDKMIESGDLDVEIENSKMPKADEPVVHKIFVIPVERPTLP